MRPAIPARTGRHRLRDSRSDKVRFSSCASPATCLYLFPCPPYRVISSSGHVAGTGGSTNTTGSIFCVLSGVEGVCRASFVLFVPWTRFLSSSHTPPPTSSPRHPPETSSTPPWQTLPTSGDPPRNLLFAGPFALGFGFSSSPSLGKSIRVRLRGEGVRPILTMLPADGRLDMGHVLEGDTAER